VNGPAWMDSPVDAAEGGVAHGPTNLNPTTVSALLEPPSQNTHKSSFIQFEDVRVPSVHNTRKSAIPPRPSSDHAFTDADIFVHSIHLTQHVNLHSLRRTPLVWTTRHDTPVGVRLLAQRTEILWPSWPFFAGRWLLFHRVAII
jgi:hypothetical protein